MVTVAQQIEKLTEWKRHLLPHALPQAPGWEWAAYASESDWPGGDYHDVLPIAGEQWLAFVGDASGHGGAAAVVAAMARMVLHSCPLTTQRDRSPFCPVHGWAQTPPVIMGRLNRIVAENALDEQFMTAFLAQWRPGQARLDFVLAGAPTPRLWRHATQTVVDATDRAGLPLGVSPAEAYMPSRITFEPGDALVVFTDGLIEARSAQGEMFRPSRVDAIVRETAADGAEAIKAGLLAGLSDFLNGRPPEDDVTLLILKRWE